LHLHVASRVRVRWPARRQTRRGLPDERRRSQLRRAGLPRHGRGTVHPAV